LDFGLTPTTRGKQFWILDFGLNLKSKILRSLARTETI